MDTTIWIIVAVVAVLIILGLALWAGRRKRHNRLHGEAVRIREEVEQETVKVDRRTALAEETAAKAHAARAEAKAKDAEATRLEQRADELSRAANESRQELHALREHADDIDPRFKNDESAIETDGAVPADVQAQANAEHRR